MKSDPYIVPGLVRGLAALRAFTPDRPELTLGDIATELGVTKSAAFRTVHTLAAEGYLLAIPGQQRFRLGPAVQRLSYGYHASRELLDVVGPVLERLRDLTDWSTHLGVLDGRHVLYLQRFAATHGLSSLVHVGSRLPAAATSMGRVLLAGRTEADIRRIYRDVTAGELSRVIATRERDRRSGVVVSVGNFESGLCSVAAPIRDIAGHVVAAISATRIRDDVPDEIVAKVAEAAQTTSVALGARRETAPAD
ncbi:MAG: IclR family transcriptional regulator [Pseudomonadota bacterium]